MHSRNTSIVIQSSANYSVLFSKRQDSFHGISSDPLYKFPVLTLEKPSRMLLNLSSFTSADTIDMKLTFQHFHQRSPFQRSSRSGLPSDTSSYISSYKNTLEMSSSYLRHNRVGESFKRQSLASSESSLAQAYFVNLNLDTGLSFSSVKSDEVVFNPCMEEMSRIDWEGKDILSSDEALVSSMDHRNSEMFVELLAESQNEESRFLYNSIEALKGAGLIDNDEDFDAVNDEGSIRISTATRMFLPGQTASKDKLADRHEAKAYVNIEKVPFIESEPKIMISQPKSLDSSSSNNSANLSIEAPDLNSPLIRKMVVFEEPEEFQIVESRDSRNEIKALQLVFSLAAVGFSASPNLEFSNTPSQSRGHISYKNASAPLICLFSPKILRQLKNLSVKLVSCGYEHAAVVTIDGKVLTWGYGASGCLGHEGKKSYSHPTAINSIFNKNIIYLECGAYHTAAVSCSGELWTWGRGDVNQLGLPNEKLLKDQIGQCALRPIRVKWLNNVTSVACGEAHTLATTIDGRVFAFGWDEDGQLGLDDMNNKEVKLPKKVVKVSAGALFSACLLESGEIMVWGSGEQGQLGLGNSITFAKNPTKVMNIEGVVDFICGENSIIALTQAGKIYGWGQGTVSNFNDPKHFPPGSDIICFLPHMLSEVDIVHKVLMKKNKIR
ncbi:hypothetical protein SteCoe_22759 [Stentor coeruleus]|uniref:RCC1-like domain-containing protein n=1 Tax=Stentor coeruleus TaxID=5963 RepID=A0A1R2BLI4_9CILI|nr:hypothetical protein SteCoe_22759 [Stentor coeruleus]